MLILVRLEEKPISFCPRCKKYNFRSVLQERVYKPDEPIPSDSEKWKQCHECSQIIPIYELKKESKLKDFVVEPSSNPFDSGKQIVGLDNKIKKTPRQKERQKQKERIEKEKDEDIKRELRKGNIVQVIEDSLTNY